MIAIHFLTNVHSEREDKKRNEQERERAKKLKKKELLERELEQMKKWAVSPEEFIKTSYNITWAVSTFTFCVCVAALTTTSPAWSTLA